MCDFHIIPEILKKLYFLKIAVNTSNASDFGNLIQQLKHK